MKLKLSSVLNSPLTVVVVTILLVSTVMHDAKLPIFVEMERQQVIQPSPAETKLPQISVSHQFVGSGLKRDYKVTINVPAELTLQKRHYKLHFNLPKSLIVDEFRLNRLLVNKLEGEEYKCDREVDLESGAWAKTSTPYTLTMQFYYGGTNENIVDIMIPEMMARYHLVNDNCFQLHPPIVKVDNIDITQQSDEPLSQCVPVSPPSLLVPLLTILVPFGSCIYLIRHIYENVK